MSTKVSHEPISFHLPNFETNARSLGDFHFGGHMTGVLAQRQKFPANTWLFYANVSQLPYLRSIEFWGSLGEQRIPRSNAPSRDFFSYTTIWNFQELLYYVKLRVYSCSKQSLGLPREIIGICQPSRSHGRRINGLFRSRTGPLIGVSRTRFAGARVEKKARTAFKKPKFK